LAIVDATTKTHNLYLFITNSAFARKPALGDQVGDRDAAADDRARAGDKNYHSTPARKIRSGLSRPDNSWPAPSLLRENNL